MQNRLLLDHYLSQLLTGKLKALHPVLRDVLHLGMYQLTQMDRIPQSAAVNESVTLAKKYCPKQKNGAALVNGVLRNAIRSLDTLLPPQVLIDHLLDYVGKHRMEAMLKANNEIPPTVVQVNTLRTTTEELKALLEEQGVSVQNHPWLQDCLVLSATGNLEQLDSFQRGLFYVQDAAAKLSVLCAGITPG